MGLSLLKSTERLRLSWGVLRNGVLETTKERLKYFGLLFQGKRADFLAESNFGVNA